MRLYRYTTNNVARQRLSALSVLGLVCIFQIILACYGMLLMSGYRWLAIDRAQSLSNRPAG
jgi:hypothetical protein